MFASAPFCVETPRDRWDILPACSDYELDIVLIDAAQHNDASAIALLEQRHDTVITFGERQRIAEALLRRVSDDSKYWDELYGDAERALLPDYIIRKLSECAGTTEDDYRSYVVLALWSIANDARSHELMLRALSSKDQDVLAAAVNGLGWQHDLAALPAIESMLSRIDEDHRSRVAFHLNAFDSEAADRVAMRYLRGDDGTDYQSAREVVH